MHRAPLLHAISAYADRYPNEQATCARFADFVTAHTDCFSRALSIGHVTGSAWLVDPSGEQVLLTHHRKLDIWVQLGGHADDDPNALDVALREAIEESGIAAIAPVEQTVFDLDIHRIPARGAEPAHDHFDVRFALRATESTQYRVSVESKALAWVPIAALARFTREESMLRMQDKWLRRR